MKWENKLTLEEKLRLSLVQQERQALIKERRRIIDRAKKRASYIPRNRTKDTSHDPA